MMSFAQNIQQCFLILLLFYQQLIFLQTIDNIQVRQMYNKPDIEIFKQIIRNLHNLEYVSPKLLQQLSLSQKNELSCYAGLINLLYNIAREGVQIIEIQKRSRVANLGMQQDAQQQPEQFNGHILKIRGQIIRQYAKMLAPVLPEPAYSLARFNFADFNAYCIRRDIGYLLRHTRGIYPLIDIKKTPLLRFLPFYNQLKAEQSLIVGNQNWKLARKIMNIFYQQQVKTDKIFESQMDIQENNQVDYSYERGGIKLSYILLTQGHQQMESFIKNLENDIQGEQKNNIKKLKFWYQNYSKFVEQGLYTYQINKDENNKKLIYNLTVENFEQNIMSLIQKVVQLKKIQQNQNRNFILQQIAEKLVQIVQSIEQDNIVPRNQNIQNQFQYKNANKMLLLSYINVITKCLFQGQEVRNVVLQAYKKLTQNEPVQQIFNFIFYNQNQILQLYSSNKLTKFPINFNYGTQLMPKILQKILNNHPENIVQNLKRLDILESEQQLKFIMKNRMIGNVDGIVQNQFSAGQIIIDYLQDNKKRYIDLINPVPLFMPKQNERGKQLQKFIDQWRQFYSFIRKFDFDIFKNYLKVYTQLNQKNLIEKPRGPENKSEIIKIKGPLYRPNIFYQIITALLKQIKKERNTFLELLQEKNLNMTKHPKSKLIDYYNIFSKPSFKSMLIDADPTFVFDEIADPNAELEKQKFQDQVWRVYADGVLIIQDMSRKIIVQGLASPQKNKKNTNLFMRSQQQRVNNFEIIQQSSQYNESNDQNMQNQV